MSRYRFATTPKWIASHLFVLFLVVLMINLGFWQLRRLDQKRTHNAEVTARTSQPVAPISEVLGVDDSPAAANAVEFRRVRATGTYLPAAQVLVRGRSLDGGAGSWVLTPLALGDGTALIVNRGWIANNGRYEAVPARYAPPTGKVVVTGLLRRSETRGSFGPTDPPTGTLTNLARADVGRLGKQIDARLIPAWLQLERQVPRTGPDDPNLLPAPTLDEGPHLSYAGQWFFFTSVALVGYPLILRRRAREVALEELEEPEPITA